MKSCLRYTTDRPDFVILPLLTKLEGKLFKNERNFSSAGRGDK